MISCARRYFTEQCFKTSIRAESDHVGIKAVLFGSLLKSVSVFMMLCAV